MPHATQVPVTPSVVKWALSESGYQRDELAAASGVSPATVESWATGDAKPTLTQLRAFANKLKRPIATFLLPRPPRLLVPTLELRRAPGERRTELNADERRLVRTAARLQRVLSWMGRELERPSAEIRRIAITVSAETAAADTRNRLDALRPRPARWRSGSAAFRWWRATVEQSGVFVLTLPMGPAACRGFSLWDDHAPVIAVNSAWSAEARLFTLFHEYGHLITRTNSACLEGAHRRTAPQTDSVERWCEQFAAAVILPLADVKALLVAQGWQHGVPNVRAVRTIATRFRASLRATTLRLIGLDAAGWNLYASLPLNADRRTQGGGGKGRDRVQLRHDQYGEHAVGLFATALQRDVVSRGDVLDYLDLPPNALAGAAGVVSAAESE